MTIAACYLIPEGVVVGADSTTTFVGPDGFPQYLDHAQKIYEVGENGSLCVVIWGLGSFREYSFRTMVAELNDTLKTQPPSSINETAERLKNLVWDNFEHIFASEIGVFKNVASVPTKTPEMIELLKRLGELTGGICLAGRWPPNRNAQAFQIIYGIQGDRLTSLTEVHGWIFWACVNIVERMVRGIDPNLLEAITASGKWNGTKNDLIAIRDQHNLEPPMPLPLREAIDWVYSMVYCTVKLFKHSRLRPMCGGPIEIAAITTDRPFRWISHKPLHAAIGHQLS